MEGKYLDVVRLPPKAKKKVKKAKKRKAAKPITKEEKARNKFWAELPESELNPNVATDFDNVLGAMLNEKVHIPKKRAKSRRKPI